MKKTFRWVCVRNSWQCAKVSWDDYDKIAACRWSVDRRGYARGRHREHRNMSLMHRLIAGVPGKVIDHINHDKLDNRRSNLRSVSQRENNQNRGKQNKNNTSGVRGVSWCARRQRWETYINDNWRRVGLGYHAEFDDAVRARKAAEDKYFTVPESNV
jgi:hypothetical protein